MAKRPRLLHLHRRRDRSPADRVFTQLVLDLQLARSVPSGRLLGGVNPEQFERTTWTYLMDYLAHHHVPDDL
jgi:hypothetical protein